MCSLPHRQLRKFTKLGKSLLNCSLPHRQLRKKTHANKRSRFSSLPHRQLRNNITEFNNDLSSVHCRTGSLENNHLIYILYYLVHCRTGSLEKI